MPKLKADEVEIDIDELEDAEYNEGGTFQKYQGEIPPKDTLLGGYISKMWYTYTKDDDPMLKVIFSAAENVGDVEEYNGLDIWENLSLTAASKFKWKPFLDHFGISLRDVKTKMHVEDEDDERFGSPITKVGSFTPGEDSEAAWCRVFTTREKYQGEWQAHVGEWLPYEDEEPDEEPDEPEDAVDEEEEEAEEAPAPARGRRAKESAAKPAAKTTRTGTKAPARSARAANGGGKAAAPARRGRRAATQGSEGFDEDPPF